MCVCVCVCVCERERERESLLLLKSFVEVAWNLQFLFLKGNARILEYLMLDWCNNNVTREQRTVKVTQFCYKRVFVVTENNAADPKDCVSYVLVK